MRSPKWTFALILLAAVLLAGVLMWPRLRAPAVTPGASVPVSATGSQPLPTILDAGASDGEATPDSGPASGDAAADAGTDEKMAADGGAPRAMAAKPCPPDMVFVAGRFCPYAAHRCLEYLDKDRETRCRRFKDDLLCEGRPSTLRFCIDVYEYPNIYGVLPVVMVDYLEAERACAAEDKRLCEAEEWTLACEGAETWPYP